MKPDQHPLEIVCGLDSGYAPHLAVMLTSLVASNPDATILCHVLCDGIDEPLRQRVAACCPSITMKWYAVENHRVLEFAPLLQISRATYLRMIMLEVLSPAIKRILYLDVDLIINGDVLPLWNMDLGNKICAAVTDPGVNAAEFAVKYSLLPSDNYFNAGVLLLDLEKLRSQPYMQRGIDILADPPSGTPLEYADQDALNIVLWKDWLPIDPAYNFQRKFLYDDYAAWKAINPVRRAPIIIHYTESFKPWRKSEWHPWAWLYLRNLRRTSFFASVVKAGKIGIVDRWKWWLRYVLKRPAIFKPS